MSELFLETLFHYREEKIFLLHEFVVMPDHIHLILTPSSKFFAGKGGGENQRWVLISGWETCKFED